MKARYRGARRAEVSGGACSPPVRQRSGEHCATMGDHMLHALARGRNTLGRAPARRPGMHMWEVASTLAGRRVESSTCSWRSLGLLKTLVWFWLINETLVLGWYIQVREHGFYFGDQDTKESVITFRIRNFLAKQLSSATR
jgi:hypothetical protein